MINKINKLFLIRTPVEINIEILYILENNFKIFKIEKLIIIGIKRN